MKLRREMRVCGLTGRTAAPVRARSPKAARVEKVIFIVLEDLRQTRAINRLRGSEKCGKAVVKRTLYKLYGWYRSPERNV